MLYPVIKVYKLKCLFYFILVLVKHRGRHKKLILLMYGWGAGVLEKQKFRQLWIRQKIAKGQIEIDPWKRQRRKRGRRPSLGPLLLISTSDVCLTAMACHFRLSWKAYLACLDISEMVLQKCTCVKVYN